MTPSGSNSTEHWEIDLFSMIFPFPSMGDFQSSHVWFSEDSEGKNPRYPKGVFPEVSGETHYDTIPSGNLT